MITSNGDGDLQLSYNPTLGIPENKSRGSTLNTGANKSKTFSVKRYDASKPDASLDDSLLKTLDDYKNQKPFNEIAPVAADDLAISETDSAHEVETKITEAFNKFYLSDMDKTISTLFNNMEASFLDAFIDYNIAQNPSTNMTSDELFGKLLNAVDLRYEYSIKDDQKPRYGKAQYTSPNGEKMPLYSNLHCVVVNGVGKGMVSILDPQRGPRKVNFIEFTKLYMQAGQRALVI